MDVANFDATGPVTARRVRIPLLHFNTPFHVNTNFDTTVSRMYVMLDPCVQFSTAEMDSVLSVSCTSNTYLSISSISNSNLQKSRKRRLKSVGFASHNKVAIVERTEETWYSLQEYAAFEQEVRSLIRKHRCQEGEIPCNSERGLEKYLLPQFHEEKKERQRLFYGAIFQEQFRQKKEGLCDAKKLAVLSRLYSRWATERAIALAKQYEEEALEEDQDWELA